MAGPVAGPIGAAGIVFGGALALNRSFPVWPDRAFAPESAWRRDACRLLRAWPFALALVAQLVSAQAGPIPVPGLKLPRDFVPLAYLPRLTIDPDQGTFSGRMDIEVRVDKPTDVVWLNARNLAIGVAYATLPAAGEEVRAKVIPAGEEVIGLKFAKELPAGAAMLSIAYDGPIDTVGAIGVFRQQDLGRWYVYTQFEPIDARRAFPCFDEPDRKAPWHLTLVVPELLRAVANMPVESERSAGPGWREVRFARSPPLPSYLVAFAVGDFDVRDAGRAGRNRTPISIIAPKGRGGETAYAAAHTGKILAAVEQYFDIPYPFPKLDLIAYPKSTFGGAMENAGLITYTARNLLARPDEQSTGFEQRFMGITAHEVAQMWFGDYVTMTWWDDLWLNEAFASWMASAIVAQLRPDWDSRSWPLRQRSRAMEADRLLSARRIRHPVTELPDVRAAFDNITYAKGQSVLTMFEEWLGPDKFRAGVRRYVAQYAWKNATADDFFAVIAGGDDALVPALRGFVERAGVPLVDVALDCAGRPAVRSAQQRFRPPGTPVGPDERWVFPACFEFGDAAKGYRKCALISEGEQTIPLATLSCPQWVVANRTGIGYFLPRLTPALYQALPRADRVLAPADHTLLLADLNMLARNGALPYSVALPLAARQADNSDARSARRAFELVDDLPPDMLLAANDARHAAWIRKHYGARARNLGWLPRKGEDPEVPRLRELALPLVSDRRRDKALAREAHQLVQRWQKHRKTLPIEIRKHVLQTAARTAAGDAPQLFDALFGIAVTTRDGNERDDVLTALGAFREPALLARALALGLDRRVGSREATEPLRQALGHPATRAYALAWLQANIGALAGRAPPEQQGYWPDWAASACTPEERARFVAIFEARAAALDAGARIYRQSLEKIDACLALRAAQGESLNAWVATSK